MALTISSSTWTDANVRKTLSWQAALVSKLRVYAIKVTFGASDNYATNGVSADLKEGRISTLVAVTPTYTDSKLVVQYDKTNEKIKTFTGSGNGNILAEVPNSSTLVNSKVFEFLVIGY